MRDIGRKDCAINRQLMLDGVKQALLTTANLPVRV